MTAVERFRLPSCRPIQRTAIVLLLLFLAAIPACKRAGEQQPQDRRNTPQPSREPLSGYVLGQVTTRPGPQASEPIAGIEPAAIGAAFRNALLDLPIFEEEGGPGPTIHFDLEWSAGLGSAEPPPLGARDLPGSEGGHEAGVIPDLEERPDAPSTATDGPDGPGIEPAAGIIPADEAEPLAPYIVVYLSAVGGAEGDPRNQFEIQGIFRKRVPAGERPIETAERLLAEAIADLAQGILAEGAPRCATDGDLVTMLALTDPDYLLPAIREVHRRRLETAATPLGELLSSEDPEIVLAAATALGQIRDARSTGRLIDVISRRHRQLTEFILPILGQIGSIEARLYLETVAGAHDDPRIRAIAREVLDQIGEQP